MKGTVSKNNTIELSVFGKLHNDIPVPNSSTRSLFYSNLYELFENDLHSFRFVVTTYRYDRREEFSPVSNLVEIYQNEGSIE